MNDLLSERKPTVLLTSDDSRIPTSSRSFFLFRHLLKRKWPRHVYIYNNYYLYSSRSSVCNAYVLCRTLGDCVTNPSLHGVTQKKRKGLTTILCRTNTPHTKMHLHPRYLAHINVRVHWCRSAPTHLVLKGWDHSSIGDIKCFQEGTKLNIFFFSSCVQILWLYVKVRRDRVRRWVHVCDREKREKIGRGKREDRLGR